MNHNPVKYYWYCSLHSLIFTEKVIYLHYEVCRLFVVRDDINSKFF